LAAAWSSPLPGRPGRLGRVLYVKTYGGWDYEPYVATRRFYEALSFTLLWVVDPYPGWGDPAAIYATCL